MSDKTSAGHEASHRKENPRGAIRRPSQVKDRGFYKDLRFLICNRTSLGFESFACDLSSGDARHQIQWLPWRPRGTRAERRFVRIVLRESDSVGSLYLRALIFRFLPLNTDTTLLSKLLNPIAVLLGVGGVVIVLLMRPSIYSEHPASPTLTVFEIDKGTRICAHSPNAPQTPLIIAINFIVCAVTSTRVVSLISTSYQAM